jgi:tRNA nucleotidyltransferase/poly(A) polymerase
MSVPAYFQKYEDKIKNELPGLVVNIPELLIKLTKIHVAGGKAYLVGGTARDIVYDAYYNRHIVIPDDVDIEVFGLTQKQLEDILGLELTGNQFPVYNAIYDDYEIQFALPRRERKVNVGHNGFEIDVDPNMSLLDAAARRDLTINSIMIDLMNYEIIDNHNGINHLLVSKTADCVREDTFVEDALRVLRAARFIAKFDLQATNRLVRISNSMSSEYQFLTAELLEKEYSKLFTGNNIVAGLDFLQNVRWLEFLISDYLQYQEYIRTIRQYLKTFDRSNVGEFNNFINPAYTIDRELVNWSILLMDCSSEQISSFFKKINPNWDKTTISYVMKIVYHTNQLAVSILTPTYAARYLQYNCRDCMGEVLVVLSILMSQDWIKKVLEVFTYSIQYETFPIISGDDILHFIPEGKMVGLIREFYIKQHIQGVVTERSLALQMLPNVVSLIERGIQI